MRVAIGEKAALCPVSFWLVTSFKPLWWHSRETLAILGGIVVTRTVIAFFLNKDLRELAEK